MKICAVICEFNPFHNGHGYLISRAKEINGTQAVVCVMSGSFTQRGEMCVNDKYLRAKHAVLSGADAVIELPAPFAVAPAEIFASGAVKVIASLNTETTLVFGCEDCRRKQFDRAVSILAGENESFKARLEARLNGGESYIKSYVSAFEACGGDGNFLSTPNNILGVEYLKAISRAGLNIDYLPIRRTDSGYNSDEIGGKYASANGIRANAHDPQIKAAMPEYSYADYIAGKDRTERFEQLAADYLYLCDREDLKRVYGCSEGLENRLKNFAFDHSFKEIVDLASTKRYSKARIRRILTANLLGLYADETNSFMTADLPVKILAIKKERADELLPALTKKYTANDCGDRCAALTSRSYSLWRYLNAPLSYENPNEKMILV